MPKHHHGVRLMVKGYEGWQKQTVNDYGIMIDYTTKNYVTPNQEVYATDVSVFKPTDSTGDSVHHNNVQPYATTYFWKRVA